MRYEDVIVSQNEKPTPQLPLGGSLGRRAPFLGHPFEAKGNPNKVISVLQDAGISLMKRGVGASSSNDYYPLLWAPPFEDTS
jgi:hypothetical protein